MTCVCGFEFEDLGVAAHGFDLAVLDGEGLREGALFGHGGDLAIGDDQVGCVRGERAGEAAAIAGCFNFITTPENKKPAPCSVPRRQCQRIEASPVPVD
jgi:hypothetical protein